MGKDQGIPRAAGSGAFLLAGSAWNKLVDEVEGAKVEMDPTQFTMVERGGRKFYRYVEPGRESGGPRGGAGGRFIPRIGGETGTLLFLSPGTVTYCRVASDNREDGTDPEAQQVTPRYPVIEGVSIGAASPPSFDVSGRTSASLWLCTQRTRCGTLLPTIEGEFEDRIVIHNRGDKPPREEGELHRLLCEFDLTSSGSGKAIANLDQRIASDVETWYECEDDDSSEIVSDFDSDDFQSSDMSDVPNDPSDSGSDADCPWTAAAKWVGKNSCYPKDPQGDAPVVGYKVIIALSKMMFSQCQNWVAYISAAPGRPKESMLGPGQSITAGGEIKVTLSTKVSKHATRWYFTNPPCMVEQKITIRLASEAKEPPVGSSECCGDEAGTKEVSVGSWPGWCEYGGTCGTTLLTPP